MPKQRNVAVGRNIVQDLEREVAALPKPAAFVGAPFISPVDINAMIEQPVNGVPGVGVIPKSRSVRMRKLFVRAGILKDAVSVDADIVPKVYEELD